MLRKSRVGHHPLRFDAEAGVISNGGFEESDRAGFSLILHHLAAGDAGSIIDTDVDELPTDAEVAVDHASPPSGDAMPHRAYPAELLDIDMDEFAGVLPLIAANGLRFQRTRFV
jgi:hypothetical protein